MLTFISPPSSKQIKHLLQPLQHNQKGTVMGWWAERHFRCNLTYRSAPRPLLHWTLLLASKSSVQVLSCRGLSAQPTQDKVCLQLLPHQRDQEKGGTMQRLCQLSQFQQLLPLYFRVEKRESSCDQADPSPSRCSDLGWAGGGEGTASQYC